MTSATVLVRGWVEMAPEVLMAFDGLTGEETGEFTLPIQVASEVTQPRLILSERRLAGAA